MTATAYTGPAGSVLGLPGPAAAPAAGPGAPAPAEEQRLPPVEQAAVEQLAVAPQLPLAADVRSSLLLLALAMLVIAGTPLLAVLLAKA
ncbi:MAG: hypothetical protein ACR2FF_01015 [Mycobacteriales bacterium]